MYRPGGGPAVGGREGSRRERRPASFIRGFCLGSISHLGRRATRASWICVIMGLVPATRRDHWALVVWGIKWGVSSGSRAGDSI